MNGFHHVAVQVCDLEKATTFYTEVLGLAVVKRWAEADGSPRSVWLDVGAGAFVALEKGTPPSPEHDRPFHDGQPGWHLVALAIPRADRQVWEERLQRAGVPVVHRTSYTLYLRDPDGNRVGLSHYPEPVPVPT
jgi:catechol 2,3-dioxygenase-like lactoylglutathione lyase family enzyme